MQRGIISSRKDLVVVVVTVLFLVITALAVTAIAGEYKKRLLCMTHVRFNTQAILHYAEDNEGNVMINDTGIWGWDLSFSGTDRLIEYGVPPAAIYCPSNSNKTHTMPQYWQFSLTYGQTPPLSMVEEPLSPQARMSYFRVTGYFWLVDMSEQSYSSRGFQIQGEPQRHWLRNINEVQTPQTWELVTDATISETPDPETGNFSRITAGGMYAWLGIYDRTNHLDRNDHPTGGNIGFVDGHVEWRPFERMQLRSGGFRPCHWW
ncbi:MAG: hypothetical protein JXA82_06530 [Sedimentisphaerales bacterium]|nr:hypothetical protein [Sedimentisphaerales bacterium]